MTDVELGHYISYILRHHPEDIGIKLDKHGYADVKELIQKINENPKYKNELSEKRLQIIVDTNNKKRYSYNEDKTKIRAVQGHNKNIKVENIAKLAVPPVVLYHGTSIDATKSIKKQGLVKMNRNAVHLSKDIETATSVGLRHAKTQNKLVVLEIDCKNMYADGYKFYIAENGVWLTEEVPSKYIKTYKET